MPQPFKFDKGVYTSINCQAVPIYDSSRIEWVYVNVVGYSDLVVWMVWMPALIIALVCFCSSRQKKENDFPSFECSEGERNFTKQLWHDSKTAYRTCDSEVWIQHKTRSHFQEASLICPTSNGSVFIENTRHVFSNGEGREETKLKWKVIWWNCLTWNKNRKSWKCFWNSTSPIVFDSSSEWLRKITEKSVPSHRITCILIKTFDLRKQETFEYAQRIRARQQAE